MENEKIRILVVPSDFEGGVGFFRALQPHRYLTEKYGDEFECVIDGNPDWRDMEKLKSFDIIFCQRKIYDDTRVFVNTLQALKDTSVKVVLDIDDSWDLSPTHPMYGMYKRYGMEQIITGILKLGDYVTTTTDIFASQIQQFNPNPVVLPNAINPNDPSFTTHKKPSDKLRFGFIMGSAHEYDVKLMGNFVSQLSQDVIDQIQIVLCGFDLRGRIEYQDPVTHEIKARAMAPKEGVWYRYENMVTNNRAIISPLYRKFLNMYIPNLEYPDYQNEHYHRCWTKDMQHYYSHYDDVDVLYAPLEPKHYNFVKSQLKAIECCFSNTAIIAQNYGPYTIDLKHAIDENGQYVEGGNALLVDLDKNATDWAKLTTMLVKDRGLLDKMRTRLHEDLCGKYNLDTVTDMRAEFYRKIAKKN